MKKLITIGLVVLTGALAVPSLAAASPHGRSCNVTTSTTNRSSNVASVYQFRAGGTMNGASVSYVANEVLRPTLARQHGAPRLGGPYYDGYVTWHCHKINGYHRWQCAEYTSNTWFRFTGTVWTPAYGE